MRTESGTSTSFLRETRMSRIQSQYELQIPATLKSQLLGFRRQVWTTKMVEAAGVTLFSLAFMFLCVFGLERLFDTPPWARFAALGTALAGCLALPWSLHRWVWGQRTLDNLARLLSRKLPRIGDQLLGILELTRSEHEQARSRTLCEAAVKQVAHDAARRDFSQAAPNSRHRLWSTLASVVAVIAIGLFVLFPAAAANSLERFVTPWSDTPRYTFAAMNPLAETQVVPHGEPFTFTVGLAEGTKWRPQRGSSELGNHEVVSAELRDGSYAFDLPPQLDAGPLRVSIGDWSQTIRIEPKLRPELASITASVALPQYLERAEATKSDVRGGAISAVKGSQVEFIAAASRPLSAAQIDGQPVSPSGTQVTTPQITLDESRQLTIGWKDEFGLAGKDTFKLSMTAQEDEVPTLVCEDLPRRKVVLDSEQIVFKIRARDDFGVKEVGMQWRGKPSESVARPAAGEMLLAPGGTDKTLLELAGTFKATSLDIEPQPIDLRIFAVDYYPERKRVYSAPFTLYVLSPEQHAIWITEQLSRWHRQALEVRDREMQLYETNKELHGLSAAELDTQENRRRLENQAAAEQANGRRLTNLTANGQNLVREAARNPEMNADQLEAWAQMLGILQDIAANRMPSVADLLKQGATAPSVAGNPVPAKSAPMAGQVRASGGGGAPPKTEQASKAPAVPQIVDTESSQQPNENNSEKKGAGGNKPSAPRLGLPVTTLMGKPSDSKSNTPAAEQVERAVKEQKDLLAEFQKIVDELNQVLANLEGSTLVKRLKAASRKQYVVSTKLTGQIENVFKTKSGRKADPTAPTLPDLAEQERKNSHDVSNIMDDMQAYFERRNLMALKTVLDDMRAQDVLGSLRKVADDIPLEQGVSISQCEYWSDVLDRWAEDLVASCNCQGGNCQSKGSLPPAIVLEVLQILEGEINLREDTRVAEQAKPAVKAEAHQEQAVKLSGTQKDLSGRVSKVIARIQELPEGASEFTAEIELLTTVNTVMDEAADILARPDTGSPAIAAETEAIELLLKSKRVNPKGGGGGGANPGGGGGGKTTDSALALLGAGQNQKEVREDHGVSQSLGQSGAALPEEFRAGLNEYFNRLEGTTSEGGARESSTANPN
jgi:hypothetical protein